MFMMDVYGTGVLLIKLIMPASVQNVLCAQEIIAIYILLAYLIIFMLSKAVSGPDFKRKIKLTHCKGLVSFRGCCTSFHEYYINS